MRTRSAQAHSVGNDVIELEGLSRSFGKGRKRTVALDEVTLTVGAGEIHGLLGPNGAGKSTLSRIISTIILPTSGKARILGNDVTVDPRAVRESIALVLGGDRGLYGRLTARENLVFWSVASGVTGGRRAEQVAVDALKRVGLSGIERPVGEFSRGMKQRVHLARGLAINPKILVLDEPTMGLDPSAALEMRNIILAARDAGSTILLATHDMTEAQALCDRVSLLNAGRIGFSGSPSDLRRKSGASRVRFDEPLPPLQLNRITNKLSRLDSSPTIKTKNGSTSVCVEAPQDMSDVLQAILATGTRTFSVSPPTLEDVYLAAVGDRGLHVD